MQARRHRHVTIPQNQKIPAEGNVVEVRYLDADRGLRDDIGVNACSIQQLKFKAESEGDRIVLN
jgi:hypothetical protein